MFDDWEKISNIYTQAPACGRLFLDSDTISVYIRESCLSDNIPNSVGRQLVLYCRLSIAGLTNQNELDQFIAQESLPAKIINNIVQNCLSMYISESDYTSISSMITFGTRLDVLEHSSAAIKYFWNSKDTNIALLKISKQYNISKAKIFIATVKDIILGFYKIEDTVPLLQQELGIDPKTAALLGAEVLEFLAPLSDPNWQPPVETDDEDDGGGAESLDTAHAIPLPVTRIPVKAPPQYPNENPIPPAPSMAAPTPVVSTPLASTYTSPAPVGVPATPAYTPSYETAHTTPQSPAVEPIHQSAQPAPARPPLSVIPSYAQPPTPVATPVPPPAPDRPRWSTDI